MLVLNRLCDKQIRVKPFQGEAIGESVMNHVHLYVADVSFSDTAPKEE